jgi:cell fate (sporulation/competence/biofilm development) regulator YlbF (YheA/YmcA/DUF963 family)
MITKEELVMSVYDLANRMARQIKKSDEYKEYLKKREKVVSNEKTKEMLLDFQQEQMKLQAKQLSGEDLSEEEKEKLENLRELVELNSNLKQYLQAEYKVNVMLNDIQKIVFGDLDLGIEPEKENKD